MPDARVKVASKTLTDPEFHESYFALVEQQIKQTPTPPPAPTRVPEARVKDSPAAIPWGNY